MSSKSIVYLVAVHVLWSFRSMVRSFQVKSFHLMVSSFRSFSVKLNGERAFLAYGLENEVHT